jgi:hypothetical protein
MSEVKEHVNGIGVVAALVWRMDAGVVLRDRKRDRKAAKLRLRVP